MAIPVVISGAFSVATIAGDGSATLVDEVAVVAAILHALVSAWLYLWPLF